MVLKPSVYTSRVPIAFFMCVVCCARRPVHGTVWWTGVCTFGPRETCARTERGEEEREVCACVRMSSGPSRALSF